MAIEISAVTRAAKGTGASRRLRRSAKVPGVVYGAGKDAVSVEFDMKALNVANFPAILAEFTELAFIVPCKS